MDSRMLLPLLAVTLAGTMEAQQRAVNLTGRPAASIDDGISSVLGLHEVAPGKVVLSDIQEQRLLMGDFGTRSIRDIGTKGAGPGEWQIAMSVSPGAGGTAYVADPSLQKIHVIDASGKIVRTEPFPQPESASPGTISIVLPRGSDSQGRLFMTGSPFTAGSQTQPDSIPILRWDPRSKRTDTLAMIKNEAVVQQSGSGGNLRVATRIGGGPLSPSTQWAPLPDGRVAIVHPEPYRVDIASSRGQVQRGSAVSYTPVRVGKAERDRFRQQRANAPRLSMRVSSDGGGTTMSTGGGPPLPEIPDSDFPATMPPFTSNAVQVAPNGEIWVLRTRPASDNTPSYDIWSPAGRLVGKATLRPHSMVVGFGQGSVYVARQDPEDDLRYLERYAI